MNNLIELPNGNLIKRSHITGILSSSSLPYKDHDCRVDVRFGNGSVEVVKANSDAHADELREQIKAALKAPLSMTEREHLAEMRMTLEAIAEQRVLVMDDQGETVADALSELATRTLQRTQS